MHNGTFFNGFFFTLFRTKYFHNFFLLARFLLTQQLKAKQQLSLEMEMTKKIVLPAAEVQTASSAVR